LGTVGAPLFDILTGTVGGLAGRLLRSPQVGAGLVERPVRFSEWVVWRGGKKELTEKDIRKLVDKLVRRAGDADSGFKMIGPELGDEVVTGLTATLMAIDQITLDDVVDADLAADRLADLLRKAAPDAATGLDGPPADMYAALLHVCCVHIVEFFTRRPEFVTRATVAQVRAVAELRDEVRERSPDLASEAARFETHYRDGLLPELDQEHLFGLQLPLDEQTYQLSTAYVSLTLQWTGGGYDAAGRMVGDVGTGPDDRRTGIRRPGDIGNAMRVEDALAAHPRLVLEGPAGAGKSTLLRRLAVHALRGDLPDQLAAWRGKVPFLLQLRNFVKDGGLTLPSPEDFVAAAAEPLAGEKPDKWVSGLLRSHRGLVLVDGVDEVPEEHRVAVLEWLLRQARLYPEAVYLLTSRPAAMQEEWRERLRRADFVTARLEPMTQRQVEDLIDRWHRAAPYLDPQAAARCAASLKDALVARRDLAQLATTPLLCAMLCALNRNNNEYLPRGRVALYNDALTMLLERREREQRIQTSPFRLTRDQLEPMLSRLAIWMTMNGRRTIPRDTALRMIDEPLRRVRGGQLSEAGRTTETALTPETALRHLVERSGLLQEPTVDLVEFRHPSFQDYLAAVEVFHQDYLEHLLRNAHDPLYHDVAIMAVGQTQRDPVRQHQLLAGLISRAAGDREHGRRLWLLAAACIADVGMVDPKLAARIHRETRRLLPPTSLEEADTVARAGEFVLDLLAEASRQRTLTDREAAATVRAAALVGGEAAMPLLRSFRRRPAEEVQRELVAAWFRSQIPEAYVDQVLADAALDGTSVNLQDVKYLALLTRVRGLRRLGMPPVTTAADLDRLVRSDHLPARLRTLSLAQTQISQLAPLAALSHLTTLDLTGTPATDSSPLAALRSVEELCLSGTQVADLAPLAALDRLTALDLRGTPVADLRPLVGLRRLEQLSLGGTQVADLAPLAALDRLTALDLTGTAVTDLTPLGALGKLRDLWLFRSKVTSLDPVADHSRLTVALGPAQAERVRSGTGRPLKCIVVEV